MSILLPFVMFFAAGFVLGLWVASAYQPVRTVAQPNVPSDTARLSHFGHCQGACGRPERSPLGEYCKWCGEDWT